MTSPSRTSARVGVRVFPDTKVFGRSLGRYLDRVERTLRVEIPTVLDTSRLDAELRDLQARLGRVKPVTVPVEYQQGAGPRAPSVPPLKVPVDALTAGFEQQVRAEVAKVVRTANAQIPLTARGETLRRMVGEQIADIERTLRAQIPTEPADAADYRRRLAGMVKAASAMVTSEVRVDVDRGFLNRLRDRLGAVIGLSQRANGTFDDLVGSATRMGTSLAKSAAAGVSGFIGMLGPLGSVVKGIAGVQYLIPGLAAGLVGLGGLGVTAFGGITAGVGGLPVLLTGLLAPIAAVTLGMDGLKRAASVLTDDVDRLKRSVSDTFERTMRPVMERLQVVFPLLTTGLSSVAEGTSRFADGLVDVVTSEAGLRDIETALAGVSVMLDAALPGAQALLNAVLNVAGTAGLWQILGDTIGGVTARLGFMLERMRSSGDLESGLAGVRDILFSVTDLFVNLAEGSLRFLEGAGPGLASLFDSLTATLSRIDWESLGESFGGMMEQLGQAIQDVPPERWQALADSIGALSEKFLQIVEDGGIEDLAAGITGFLTVIGALQTAITGIEDGLNGLNDFLSGLGESIYENVTQPFYRAVGDLLAFLGIASPAQKFIDIGLAIVEGMLIGLASLPGLVWEKIREMRQRALDALADAPSLLLGKGREILDGAIRGIRDKLGEARDRVADLKNQALDALSNAGSLLTGLGGALVDGFVSGITGAIGRAASAAARMAKAAYDAAKNALGISSPSRLFATVGRHTVDGYLSGLRDRFPEVNTAMRTLVDDAVRAASPQRMIQAEDGSFVPESFYGGRSGSADLATVLEAAFRRALASGELRAKGRDLAFMLRDIQLDQARR